MYPYYTVVIASEITLLLYPYEYVFFIFVKLHVFVFFVPCCDVRCDFRVKTMLGSSLLLFVMSGIHVLLMLFAFIYAY